jgi:hypothetical protein
LVSAASDTAEIEAPSKTPFSMSEGLAPASRRARAAARAGLAAVADGAGRLVLACGRGGDAD